MALAARLWRFLPWARGIFPGPWLSRGAAGSRGLCRTWRLRGSEVPPPPWLPLSSLLAGLRDPCFSQATPYHSGECGELRKVLRPGVLELSRWLLRTGLLPFARLLSSLKTGVGGGMSSPLTPSPGILPVFPVWKQRTLAGAGGLDRCENVYFWRYCTAPEALSLSDFGRFVVWFWKLLRLRSREFVVFRFKIFWVLCTICIMLRKDVGLSSQFWLFY